MSVALQPAESATRRDRLIGGASLAFVLDMAAGGVAGLRAVDALLVLAINQANIAPLRRDPQARARYGTLDAPAPDEERRPVSINAVAASLGMPFETVRRRIRKLAADGVCADTASGVVVPESFLAAPDYLMSVMAAYQRLRGLYTELRAAELIGSLRESSFTLDGEPPVRAAAGLVADYVLRTAASLVREGGDVTASLILLALLTAALPRPVGGTPASPCLSVAAIAKRLGMPTETVRRNAANLIEEGACVRWPAGFAVSDELLGRPGLRTLLADNSANVQRLFTGLAERGLVQAWEQG